MEYGHLNTRSRWECRDGEGSPIPWFTYPAIDYLRQLDLSDKRVFEYGCGFSTLFWAAHAKNVVSVDNNPEWFGRIKKVCLANVKLHLVQDLLAYPKQIALPEYAEGFDIVVIDGRARGECAREAVKRLKRDGMLILDNAERYPDILQMLSDHGLLRVDMIGFGPIASYVWDTAFFFSPEYRPRFAAAKPLLICGDDTVVEDDALPRTGIECAVVRVKE
jgi:hypothetical protein